MPKSAFIPILLAAAVAAGAVLAQPDIRIVLEGPDGPRAPESEIAVIAFIEAATDVNAFSATIAYPADILEFRSADTANSIVNFWSKRPARRETGFVALEGGIMGEPFRGRGELVTLKFIAKAEGRGMIRITESQVLLADGKGTSAATVERSKEIVISAGAPGERPGVPDAARPEIVFTEIIKNPTDSANILIFRIEERESGLASSGVRFRKWFWWGGWQEAENQIRVPPGAWQMQIRAVDSFGNERTETLTRKDVLAQKTAAGGVVTLLVAAGAYLGRRTIAAVRRRNK